MDAKYNTTVDEIVNSAIDYYNEKYNQFILRQFMNRVKEFFEFNPIFYGSVFPVVHSVKARLKDPEHLRDKLKRKVEMGVIITKETLFHEITDLAGVRVLHLCQDQLEIIHEEIMTNIKNKEWVLREKPKAYNWDPEATRFFEKMNLEIETRDSYYTSIHYVVRPNPDSDICCEIQVRTLFEEIWGEMNHAINYPHKTENIACIEQLKSLSYVIGAGKQATDAIYRLHREQTRLKKELDI